MKGIIVALWATLFFGISAAVAQGDVNAPVLVDLTIEPDHIWTNDGPQTITVTARFTDDLSGFKDAFIVFAPQAETTQSHSAYFGGGWNDIVEGDALDGIYVDTVTLPQYAAEGWWIVRQLSMVDVVGNRKDYFESGVDGFPDQLREYRFYNGETIPEPTPTPTDEPSETPAPTEEVTETPTDEPSETPMPTEEVAETPTPDPTDEPSETPAPTEEVTETPTPTPTDKPSETPSPTEEVAETPTPDPSDIFTRIYMPSVNHHFLIPDDPGHNFPFTVGEGRCDPNAGQTYFQGFVRDRNNNPINGVCVHIHFYEPRNTKCSGCDGVGDGVWGFSPFGGPAPPGTPVEIYVVACEGPMPQGGQTAQTGFGDLTPQSPKWTRVIHESEQCTGITFYRR